MLTAHMSNEKKAEELLAETRSPEDPSEYAIRREKGLEINNAIKQPQKLNSNLWVIFNLMEAVAAQIDTKTTKGAEKSARTA